jgi:hypothetical protein
MTIRETLKAYLPEGIASAAIFNLQAQGYGPKRLMHSADDPCDDLGDALMSFIWNATDEGFDYWEAIYRKYKGCDYDPTTII